NPQQNDTMVEAFQRRCMERGIKFSCTNAHMRCMPHTIHLSTLKLLEAIGVLTKEEKRAAKSKSQGTVYQESATESLHLEADEEAGDPGDGVDNDTAKPTNMIGCAVFNVFGIPLKYHTSLTLLEAPKNRSACSIKSAAMTKMGKRSQKQWDK
ncbi:hypothetical protein B0H10DRAFT_1824512, partial [Mycena sp. CBHHK59/15]